MSELNLDPVTSGRISRPRLTAALILVVLGGPALFGLTVLSIALGAADIGIRTVWKAIFFYDVTSTAHQIIRDLRLPRAIIAVLVGVCLSVAGAIMQGMTRNPLASPSIMGINSGSAFFIVLAFILVPGLKYEYLILVSFLGAAFGALLVFGTAFVAKDGLNPLSLVLAGAAVSALLSSFSGGLSLYYRLTEDLMYWYAGGIAGVDWTHVRIMLPWGIGSWLAALVLAPFITLISLGDDVASGLGVRLGAVKLAGSVVVLILAGAAVSTAGPVGFVGLIVPHIARALVGVDYRLIIPCSGILGGLLLVGSDILARMINPPYETPLGFITAIIGVPFFLYLARRQKHEAFG